MLKHIMELEPKVNEIDNRLLSDIYEKRNQLCNAIISGDFDFGHSIDQTYFQQIYNTCALEGNPVTLENAVDMLKNGLSIYQKASNQQSKLDEDEKEIIGMAQAFAYMITELDETELTVEFHQYSIRRVSTGSTASLTEAPRVADGDDDVFSAVSPSKHEMLSGSMSASSFGTTSTCLNTSKNLDMKDPSIMINWFKLYRNIVLR
uniref:Uncharacterized protein n=1 Tax=Acrobeloides nanus TaxID=290746 RepID=A0A914E781_9BILA